MLVAGDEGIVGRGSAASWEQIATLLGDARDDRAIDAARTTAERAARAEQALAAAGVAAGHASLYPSRRPTRGAAVSQLLFFVVGAVVAVHGAARAAWSPCGQSMLASLTPVAERARGLVVAGDGHRFRRRCDRGRR